MLESLANHVARNSQASLADLKEFTIYLDEAARLRRRADESADNLPDFTPSDADVGSVSAASTTTETPEQRRERLRRCQEGLKKQGVRDYAKRVADEEGITTARTRPEFPRIVRICPRASAWRLADLDAFIAGRR